HELLAFDRLQLTMDDVRPLERLVKLFAVELTAPTLDLTRDRAGRLNLLPPTAQVATKNIAADAHSVRATGQNYSKPQAQAAVGLSSSPAAPALPAKAAATPWKVQVGRVAVRAGSVNWLDETLSSPARIRLTDIALNASAIAVPFAASAPLQFNGSLGLDQPVPSPLAQPNAGTKATAPALLSFSGSATDQAVQATATVAAWPLSMATHYVGQLLLPALDGQLDAQLGLTWQAAGSDKAQVLQVTAPQMALSDVLLAQGKSPLVSIKRLDLAQVDIDVAGQSFRAASMRLSQPKARVERDADKRWMYERWMVRQGMAPPPAAATTEAKADAPSWAVAINDVLLDGGAMSFSDKAGAKPVAFEVTALKAQLGGLVLDDRPTAKALAAKPSPLTASLRLGAGRLDAGGLDFKGSLGLAPLQAQGQLVVSRLPLQAFEPYFAETLNIELLRADASFKGRVGYRQTAAGPLAQVVGDMALEEFRANTLAPSEDLLAW
ncbi:MAG: DUF748 domain-containing protein, partial [Polaromonas sp.]